MISINQIQRFLTCGAYTRLVERVLANGRCHLPLVRQRLSSPGSAEPAGLGLALQRACELTYGPTQLSDSLAARLLAAQRSDGLFGDRCIAATAVAINGLLAWRELRGDDAADIADAAIACGVRALRALQQRCGTIGGDVVGSAIVLWQLGPHETFRTLFGAADARRLDESLSRATNADMSLELTRYAHAMAA